jgi:hypothetical protein
MIALQNCFSAIRSGFDINKAGALRFMDKTINDDVTWTFHLMNEYHILAPFQY